MKPMTHRVTPELKRLHHKYHDYCMICNYEFKHLDTTHLGYGENNEPLYCCDNCANKIKEIAVRYSYSKRPFIIPPDNSCLWRYMDFTKYVSILSNKCLYFASADSFQDVFEGAKGLRNRKGEWDSYYLDFFRGAIKSAPNGHGLNKSQSDIDEEAKRLLFECETIGIKDRKVSYISCWHENNHESEAMWKLYSNYMENAVAIKTSYKSLRDAMHDDLDIQIGRVEYVDFSKEFSGVNGALWRKRKSFEHEKEVRAITKDFKCNSKGKNIECDLSILIESVYISPLAPSWFLQLVNDVNSRFGLDIKVSSSNLTDEPFY
ncbi:TPA: hypothetical protein U5D40_000061 [Yersinia enterocolitica]|nr:hypothetical protein [Yersinia enterocolitica]